MPPSLIILGILLSPPSAKVSRTWLTNVPLADAALCLIAAGTYTAMPIIVCWFNMNLAGHRRRAIGSAWQVGFGNIGGIIATYSFVSTDAPLYTKGYAIGIGFVCLSALSCIAYAIAITRENKRRDKAVRDVGLTEYERMELGVSSFFFFLSLTTATPSFSDPGF